MATFLHGEPRRMYSWWWDSHISPKNSKWLQENLTDMDRNVKAMIKLIEEDADSFARRAEMYYKKRPELMKMVEEFYRAYRALAERYDHATGALRQAHRTMTEAFPNQIPPIQPDDSPSGLEIRPHTPEMPSPMPALVDLDDSLGASSHFHPRRRSGVYNEENDTLSSKKGLKQLKEMFPSGESKVRKVLNFKEEEGTIKEKEDLNDEIKRLQEEVAKLSTRNENIMSQMESESQRARTLEETVLKLESVKETALLWYKLSIERISTLETDISNTKGELNNVNDEMVVKLSSVEEQCLAMEKANKSLRLELEIQQNELEKRARKLEELNTIMEEEQQKRLQAEVALMSLEQMHTHSQEMVVKLSSVEEQCLAMENANKSLQLELEIQQNELEKRARELEELNTIMEEEQQKKFQAEVALMSLEQIHTHSQEEAELLVLEIQRGNEKLKDMELCKVGLEEKTSELNEIIGNLHDENKSFNVKINDIQNEMKLLKETNEKLEYELVISLKENKDLQKELCCLKEDQKDLEVRHQGLTEQMKVILEKNVFFENSFSDANVELEGLREKANSLEASCETLLGEVSTHVIEKGVLASRIDIISQNMEGFTEKNILLENSLSDTNAELEISRARCKDLEECCKSHCDQNSTLIAEKNTLVSQVENLESKYSELQCQHSNLEREKDLTVQRIMELQNSLRIEKQEHEALIMSLSSQLATLHNQIYLLEEEIQMKVKDFEMEQENVMNSLFEIFILQICLCDMKDSNVSLFRECQNLLEASRYAENQISQLKHKKLMQTKEIASLLERNDVLSKGIHLLLEELNIGVKKNSITEEVLMHIILSETKNLLISISNARDENQQLHLKILNLESEYLTLQDHHNNLEREKDSAVHQVMELESSLRLQKQEHESLTLSFLSQLASSQKKNHLLQEDICVKDVDLEIEQQKTMNAELENFVLQKCLCDMKDKNLILSVECQNLLETLCSTENRISQCEHRDRIQKKEIASLLEHNEVVSKGIHLLLEELNVDDKKDGVTDEVFLQIILGEVKDLLISIFDAREENHQLQLKVLSLEGKYLTLQDHHNNLEREKDSTIHQVMELENSLTLQKQEHEVLTLSLLSQLASLRKEIHFLQEEIRVRDVDLEMDWQNTINADLENFVLQRCLCDMKDNNLTLSVECQSLLEALQHSEKHISQLEHKYLIQKKELTLLSNHSEVLRASIHEVLQALSINIKNGIMDYSTDEVLLQTILGEIRHLMSSISDANDENQCLRLELLVKDTLFKQIGLDKLHLYHELDNQTKELLALEREKHDLNEMKKQLKDEKNFFISQVEIIRHSLEILETKYSEVEEKKLNVEREKDLAFHQVSELESSLKLEKLEHRALLSSSNSQLASLETQLDLLKKERLIREDEFEIEQQNTMNALLENFILQSCLHDMKDSNSLLSVECQKLEYEHLIKEKEMTMVSENNEKLRSGILLLLKELNINKECGTIDETKDEALLQTLRSEIKTMINYVSNGEEKMQHLHIEISVLVTLLKHVGLEKSHLYDELASQNQELFSVQNRKDEAIQILTERLSALYVSYQRLHTENRNLVEERHLLSKRVSDLREKMDVLEGENNNVFAEALTLDYLFIFFKSLSVERGLKLKLLSDDIYSILAIKNGLDEKIRVQNERKRELEVENMNLMELAVLQEFDLNVARNFCEEFNQQVEDAGKLLIQKKMEISDAREENTELCRKLEGLNKDLDCAKVIRKASEKEIETLSSNIASKDEEFTDILETNWLLHTELDRLNCEVQALKRREEFLSSELQKRSGEVCKCEGEIQTLLNDTHISTVNAVIFEEKVLELIVECWSLETFSMLQREILVEEFALRNACIDDLKKKLEGLEGENGSLKAELNAYSSLLMSLFDDVASAEEHIFSLALLQETPDNDILDTPTHMRSHQPTETEKISDLQKLIAKIESLQMVIIDTKNLLKQERSDSSAKIESAMKEIEELKHKEILLKEISKEVQTMKDIQLDQMSNSHINSSKTNRNEYAESDEQMLELWEETAERDDGIEVAEEVKSEHPSCELSINMLEVSTRINESPQEWNKRVNEKLDSDAQRLSVIQRSLREFRTKLEGSKNKKQPDNWEYGTLKMQLREADEAILLEVDVNGKLKKKVEENFESPNERRKISEQAKKGSEKIGKLEEELQKIEYIFLKVQEENENKKNVGVERKSSILLSEYIYGKKDGKGKRRSRICGCMRPKTKN